MRDDYFKNRSRGSGTHRPVGPTAHPVANVDSKLSSRRTINIKLQLPKLPSVLSRQVMIRMTAVIGVAGLAAGMYTLGKHDSNSAGNIMGISSAAINGTPGVISPNHVADTSNTSATAVSGKSVSIDTYYPENLPKGYTYNNDAKALKADVLYYSVGGPDKQLFYITQQPIPANFDFIVFNKKFLAPDNFDSEAGTVTAGRVGANLLGSIRTKKNTWIIINTTNGKSLPQLEAVARSLK